MRAHKKSLQAVALAGLLFAGSVFAASSSWSFHSGAPLSEYPALVPFVYKDNVVHASIKGDVFLMDRTNGRSVWRQRTGMKFSAGPVTDGRVVVVGTNDGHVVAFSHATGDKLWDTQLDNVILAAPSLGAKNTVMVQLADGTLQALFLSDGTPRWSVSRVAPALTVRVGSSPLVNEDDVFVGFPNGRVLSVNTDTGAVNWERDLSLKQARTEIERLNDIVVTPRLFGNTLVVLNAQGRLIALSRQSGAVLWESKALALKDYALNAMGVYAVTQEGHLMAIDRVTGAVLWENRKISNLTSGVAMMGNRLIVGDKEGKVHSVSAQTGQPGASLSVNAEVVSTPLVQGNQVIVSSKNGRVDAFYMPA